MSTRVYKRMDHLFKTREKVLTVPSDVNRKYAIFSDFHRGVSDYADDFKPKNRLSYTRALSYYFNNGYTLVHLGDVEELKEQFLLGKVVEHDNNRPILINEKIFYSQDRYLKVYGNHDSQWGNSGKVKKYLHPHFPDIEVYEAIVLEYDDGPDIMMVHGHQGYSWVKTNIAEKLVLPFYKLGLNIFGISRETNYESYCKIEKTEKEFYDWTEDQNDLILIFGHTHRPLWGSSTHLDRLEKQYKALHAQLNEIAIANGVSLREVIVNKDQFNAAPVVIGLRDVLNKIGKKKKEAGTCRSPLPLPIVFNTGCCIFEDGDITGMEIEDGQLRLVKWGEDESGNILKTVLESGALDSFTIPE